MSDEERQAMYGVASLHDEDSDDMEWEEVDAPAPSADPAAAYSLVVDMRDKPGPEEVIEFTLQVDKGKAPAKKCARACSTTGRC